MSLQVPGRRSRGRPSNNLYVLKPGTVSDDLVLDVNCSRGPLSIVLYRTKDQATGSKYQFKSELSVNSVSFNKNFETLKEYSFILITKDLTKIEDCITKNTCVIIT